MKVTRIFRENQKATSRVVVNQGGSRSSKTYSICQLFIVKLLKEKGKVLSICRKTLPSLKSSVMRDFFEILNEFGLYSQENHNKTEHTYVLNGNLIEFLSMDMPQKKRGAKRDYLWLNEANEFSWEDFIQLAMRTSGQIFLDYNPSDEFHWIYDRVIPRTDCTFIKSTYLDNPFLAETIKREIESLKEIDDNYWRIYGLGEKGHSTKTIYTNWDIVPMLPESYDDFVWGIDFGYNHPSVLAGIAVKDTEIFIKEFIYERGLTNQAFIQRMFEVIPDHLRFKLMKADSAEPDRIQEISNAGFNVIAAKKGKNSVKNGIDVLKRSKMHFTADSVNSIKEVKGYSWKVDKDDRVLDEPVKFKDDAMDAIRYGVGLDTEDVDQVEAVYPDDLGMDMQEVTIGQDEEVLMKY